MNPPFGAQKAHADRPFIDRALELAGEVYGIFNEGSTPFVAAYTEGRATIEEVIRCAFPMKRTCAPPQRPSGYYRRGHTLEADLIP